MYCNSLWCNVLLLYVACRRATLSEEVQAEEVLVSVAALPVVDTPVTPLFLLACRRASLSEEVQAWAEEVALDEQGHVRMVRQVLGADDSVTCPKLDITGGFRAFFDNALNKTSDPAFDPHANDINFLLSTWSLEEIGATGDKVREG
jgi:hypothetical protein